MSSNITVTNPFCGSQLTVGNTVSVQINVTNVVANEFEGYELYLYYDPSYLSAVSADTTSSPTVFSNPFMVVQDFVPAGTVHLVGACLACNDTGPGTIVNINFKILATGVIPLTLAAGIVPNGNAQSFTVLGSKAPNGAVLLAPDTADGYFKNEPTKLGPVARFTFSPATCGPGVTFNATESYDPDAAIGAHNKGIAMYEWDFGGALTNMLSPFPILTFGAGSGFFPGNFSVRLTVIDGDNNFQGMQTNRLTLSQPPLQDFSISASPCPLSLSRPPSSSSIVTLTSRNGFSGAVSLSATVIPAGLRVSLRPTSLILSPGGSITTSLTVRASGRTPIGNYTITIAATSGSLSHTVKIPVEVTF